MPTKAQAIDHLVDVLAGENVVTTGTTAQRIMQLSDMIEDGEISIGGGDGGNALKLVRPWAEMTATTLHEDDEPNTPGTATFKLHGARDMVDGINGVINNDPVPMIAIVVDDGVPTLIAAGYDDSSATYFCDYINYSDDVWFVYAHPSVFPLTGDADNAVFDEGDDGIKQIDPADIDSNGDLTIVFDVKQSK